MTTEDKNKIAKEVLEKMYKDLELDDGEKYIETEMVADYIKDTILEGSY